MMNDTWEIREGDCLERLREMPAGSVHCCVTSPPYWALRDYGVDGQFGLEKTPREYIDKMVAVFEEVRRVLRDDATAWINIGDSYATGAGAVGDHPGGGERGRNWPGVKTSPNRLKLPGLKPKDLVGVPWMLAFALRDAGWYLRSDCIWAKRAPMPESVQDRPTKAHEYVFLLSKSQRYFYDQIASGEEMAPGSIDRYAYSFGGSKSETLAAADKDGIGGRTRPIGDREAAPTRNMRTVWSLSPESYSGAHFAVMPTELVRRCLLAGTSEHGCCWKCGKPYERITRKERKPTRPGTNSKVSRASAHADSPYNGHSGPITGNRDPHRHCTETVTVGWDCDCGCDPGEPAPCTVLDPFSGAGTVGVVARRLGLRYIGIELNPEYAAMSRQRIRDDRPLFNGV